VTATCLSCWYWCGGAGGGGLIHPFLHPLLRHWGWVTATCLACWYWCGGGGGLIPPYFLYPLLFATGAGLPPPVYTFIFWRVFYSIVLGDFQSILRLSWAAPTCVAPDTYEHYLRQLRQGEGGSRQTFMPPYWDWDKFSFR